MTRPTVWLDYDQETLDKQYDQRSIVPDGDAYRAHDAEVSAAVRATMNCVVNQPYGDDPTERLDLFPAAAPGSPVLIFLHGGAWTRGSKSNESFIAPPFVAHGAAVVCPEFSLAPAATLDAIVDQCRRAVRWVYDNAEQINGNRDHIVLAGHSSGSHLSSILLTTDWAALGLPENIFRGIVITSGIYDLAPVKLSYRNTYLFLDDAAVDRLSPIRRIKPGLAPVAVYIGGGELAEFRRQGREFADTLKELGLLAETADIPALNHFEMGRELGNPESPVHKAALTFLGLDD